MRLSAADWQALTLSFQLAGVSTLLLLVLATPLAWWLARSASRWRSMVAAVVALPLVLPSSVLGFYLLILLGDSGPIGRLTDTLGVQRLPFSFEGLVLASVLYSLPFVVQPIVAAMEAISAESLDAAATLRAGPWARFFTLVLPLCWPGFVTAAVLGFAHTLGEFGVVLMIGGSLPGETRVAAIQLYEHVEALDYAHAHGLAAVLLTISFLVLWVVYVWRGRIAGLRGVGA
ncbi:MAG: molybdate ABC transporter permease subunit [Abyssibacter sp.]|uniref:molybdate ABC transporter permease subunit n=1 Tax=Abyssibacter sp. TaxID=2320200 RepID=UPI00321AC30B